MCGERAAPTVHAPGRQAVPNAPAGGALPCAMDAARGAAGSGAARCVRIGLPPSGKIGAAAPAPLLALAARGAAARPARGERQGLWPRSTAAAGGLVCARHRALPYAAFVQRGVEHSCQRAHEGHCMDGAQARVAAQAQPAAAGFVVASQATRVSPNT